MNRRALTLAAAGLLVCSVALPAVVRDLARLRENRAERWSAMGADQRDELRALYDDFLELSSEDRAVVERHARSLSQVEDRLVKRLEASDLEALEALPAAKRRELLDELVVQEARNTAQRILRKLPPDVRVRLRNATPSDRARFLQNYKAEESRRIDRAYQHLATVVGLSPSQVAHLQRQPIDKRRQSFVELAATRVRATIEARGVPAGIATEVWSRVEAMEPLDFLEAVVWLREYYPDFGGLALEGEPGERLVHRKESVLRLKGALLISDHDRIRLADRDRGDRRLQLEDLQRQRATRVIREESLLRDDQLTRLEALASREFFYIVRALVMDKPVTGALGVEMFPQGAGPPGLAPAPGGPPTER